MALTAKKVYAILKRQISNMEAKLNSPVRYRGTVATADLLPLNPDIGDMYNIESKSVYGEAGMNVAWNGVVWDTMGAPIDMSLYLTKEEAETVIQRLVTEYFEKNPVKPGATTEQAQQIEQNKTDIASLKTETGSLKGDINNKIITDSSINKANPNEYSDGVVIAGKISSLKQGYRHTGYIECKKKDIIRTIRSANISEYYIVEYYDSNKTYVTNSYTLAQENDVAEFTVPDNNEITHCRVNFRIENQDTFMVTINTPYPTDFKPYYHIEYLNNISEKTIKGTILFSGDSICYGAGYSGGYASIIQKRNPLATIVNYGILGTTVAKRNERTDSILERLDTMQSEADYVIFEGGVNDAWDETVEIGTFNKSANVDSTTTFNEETFSGALESLFNKAYKKYPKAHIMFVIVSVSDNYSTYEYLNRAKEICEKWKVTPIDIRESGLNLMIKECVSLYGAGGTDGTHPSKLGYEKFFVPMIESKIKKYL